MATLAVGDLGTGGGFAATVTGGASGDAHTLYRALVADLPGPVTWTASGTRTGNGTIAGTASPAGYFWWRLDTVPAATPLAVVVSNLVYQRLTATADSCHDRILDAVVALVQSMALTGVDSVVNFEMPDKAAMARVTLPAVVVSSFGEVETEDGGTHSRDDIGYPVTIMILDRMGEVANVPRRVKGWRETICDGLRSQRLPGVAESLVTRIEPGPVLESDIGGVAMVASATKARVVCRRTRGLFGAGSRTDRLPDMWPGPMW